MGENEVFADSLPNGLLPGTGPIMRAIDTERWLKVEERTAELIACIQPNQLSEDRRNAVADYVQRLIMKCFRCKVCTFGSVPLKTYLPDGDIDLTVFSQSQDLKDSWANLVVDMLESEEKNEHAEFHVKEVQYIQAEVKIIKCLVENIVVDISFNQVGGLCTLCFLVEVDNLIQQNHLFKRSIILIKAWCYYESRILGAHHGLISTYALETLVLYIFHVFNNSFHGPLEVLYRFLEFFSNFDWDHFCVSLWGPVPISSLPDVTAEPPRKDKEELLLSKLFLDACSLVYAVFPGGQENNGQPFVCKHFNVIDPLRMNNNLGRSVSKGNFYRIRSAFAFGAKKLARLLDCPEENLIFEVNQFFMNTWKRHSSGHRPDAMEIDSKRLGLSTLNSPQECDNDYRNSSRGEKVDENSATRVMQIPSMFYEANQLYNLKSQYIMPSSILADLSGSETNGDQVIHSNELRGDPKGDYLDNDTKGQFIIPRTRSSPELTDLKDNSSTKHIPSQRLDATAAESNGISKNCRQELAYVNALSEEDHMMQQQEEQDIVNMMATASLQAFNSSHQVQHVPFNLNSFQAPPSFLASMGYPQPGFFPANNFPFMDPSLSNMHFPHGLVSPRYFPGNGVNAPSEDPLNLCNGNFGLMEANSTEANSDGWNIVDVGSCSGFGSESTNCEPLHPDDKLPPSPGLKYVPPHRVQQKHSRESESLQEPSDFYAEERSESSKFSSVARNNSLRSRASVESSWDESVRTPGEKWGRKVVPTDLAVEGKITTESVSNQVEDDDQVFERPNVPGFEVAQTSVSDSMMPFPNMLIGPGSRQRLDNNAGITPCYTTGPPIPFLTMLPFPSDTGKAAHFGSSENLSLEGLDQSEDLNSPSYVQGTPRLEPFEERRFDILNSDFGSHWFNLQVGRSCQNPVHPGLLPYLSSPIMVPPVYIQGRFQYDPSFRPLSTNMNMFSQLMTTSYGDYPVPVSPLSRPPNLYQEMPRYRSGTGTYLPNPKVGVKERGGRRGHDRNDYHSEREGNWNFRSRGPTRGHNNRNQTERSNARADRPWSSSNGSLRSDSTIQNGPQNVVYNSNGPTHGVSNGVMMYHPIQNGPIGDPAAGIDEQNEERAFEDQNRNNSRYRSPDHQPSSPHNHRRV